jgi:septal ring factor EnvC (AmiA/AmiB activator)
MYRRSQLVFIVLIILIASVFSAGCRNSEEIEKLNSSLVDAQSQNDGFKTAIAKLQTERNTNDSLRAVAKATNDSLMDSNQKLKGQIAALESEQKTDRATIAQLKTAFENVSLTAALVPGLKNEVAANKDSLVAARDTIRVQANEISELRLLYNNAMAWLNYYMLDAARNWWEEFWGSGKPTKPDVPEPPR